MNQVFRIEIDGVDVTDYHTGTASISRAVGRFYNTAKFIITDENIANNSMLKDMQIFYGDSVFSGFIFSISKNSKLEYEFLCRTYGAKLTEPFSPNASVIENAALASELCSIYANDINYPISYNLVDLDFSGNYSREGTKISALTNIANVLGADYYDNGSGIIIEANKPVGDEDVSISVYDYFDFAKVGKNVLTNGVGEITISTADVVSKDIVSNNSITLDIFDDLTARVYTNPKGLVTDYKGLDIEQVTSSIEMNETVSVSSDYSIELKAPIKSVQVVKLNGIEITDYNFQDGHNVLYFNTPKRGVIDVSYTGYYQRANVHALLTPLGYFYAVDLYYLDQELSGEGIIKYLSNAVTVGEMTIFTPTTMNIARGYDIWVYGGVPRVELYANGDKFYQLDAYEEVPHIQTIDVTLEPDGLGGYTFRIPHKNPTVELVQSYGKDISYTTSTLDGYVTLKFSQYYAKIKCTYTVDTRKFTIPPTFVDGDIIMRVVNLNDDRFMEFTIENIDWNDLSTFPCMLNQMIPINVAQELNLDVNYVAGIQLTVTHPDGKTISQPTVDVNGYLKIFVTENGDYVVNASPVYGTTINGDSYRVATITLTVNVGV